MIELTEPVQLDVEQWDVLQVLERLLDAVADRNADGMREILLPDGVATQSRDGNFRQIPLRELPEHLPPGRTRLEERFFDPTVRVDDNIAVVCACYFFLVDRVVHHFGTNILTFLKVDGAWRVSGVTDNGRTPPCRPS